MCSYSRCRICNFALCNTCYLEQTSKEQRKDDTNRKVVEIAVEFFDQELNQWPNATAPMLQSSADKHSNHMAWAQTLKVGDIVDAKDDQDKWFEAVIRYIEGSGDESILYIHYIGWRLKWDEKIPSSDMSRIQKRGTHSDGPHRPVPRRR